MNLNHADNNISTKTMKHHALSYMNDKKNVFSKAGYD